MSAPFTLGERVKIAGTAVKVKDFYRAVTYRDGALPVRLDYPNAKVFTEGVIVGSRTVMDGQGDYDDGYTFTPQRGTARRVWLVAFDLRMKPTMCFDHQVTAVAA